MSFCFLFSFLSFFPYFSECFKGLVSVAVYLILFFKSFLLISIVGFQDDKNIKGLWKSCSL